MMRVWQWFKSCSWRRVEAPLCEKRRSCCCFSSTTLVHAAVVLLMSAHFCSAQTAFEVSNPKQQKWPAAEADRIYFSTGRDLAAEFRLPQPPRAHFTLVLGANENSVDINKRELCLKKWDKYLYAEGVLRLSFDQMLAPEAKMRLARRAVAESEATVPVKDIPKGAERSYQTLHGWTPRPPR